MSLTWKMDADVYLIEKTICLLATNKTIEERVVLWLILCNRSIHDFR